MNYDLPDIVRISSLIAVVVPAQPPMYERHILFTKEWERLPGRLKELPSSKSDIPPYKQAVYCFVVKGVLKGDRKIGEHIEVIGADDGIGQTAHFNYYALGMNMSNEYDSYQPKYAVNEEGEQIVFLSPYRDEDDAQDLLDFIKNPRPPKFYEFVAHSGREGLEARPEIERLLKKS